MLSLLKELYLKPKNEIKYLILFVTNKCNANCDFCFNHKNLNETNKDLTIEETKIISSNFKNLIQLTLSGGEPILNPNLYEIIKIFYINNNLKNLTITTNGFFYDKLFDLAKKILLNLPNLNINFSISIDDIEKKHDDARKVKNLFNNIRLTYSKLSNLKNNKIKLTCATVINNNNQNKILKTIKYIFDNFDFDDHEIIVVRGSTKTSKIKQLNLKNYFNAINYRNKLYYNNSKNFLKKIIDFLGSKIILNILNKNTFFKCPAGKKMIEIDENGNVFPCELIYSFYNNYYLGNIFKEKYSDILKKENTKKIISFIKNKKCNCTFECAIYSGLIFYPISNILFRKKL